MPLALGGPKGQSGLNLLVQLIQLPQQFVVPLVQFLQELQFLCVFFHNADLLEEHCT